ncbi:Pkinase-domain-containing protein [Mycena kentingensis (nom. inval.)]|nr:Pkinase-domain-containing protein [Mycena kentingensis (nom. inval.)]
MVVHTEQRPNFTGDQVPQPPLTLVKILASGADGDVYLAKNRDTDEDCAVKFLGMKDSIERKGSDEAEKELKHHRLVHDHPNILTNIGDFFFRGYHFLILPLADGDLAQSVRNGVFNDKEWLLRQTFFKVLDSALHMHARGVYHCDLKLQNILHKNDLSDVWIADFGVSHCDLTPRLRIWCKGTRPYMPPEPLYDHEHHPRSRDAWALGILLINFLTGGSFPWQSALESDADWTDFKGNRRYLQRIFPTLSPRLCQILNEVFHPEAAHRLSVSEFKERLEQLPTFFATPQDRYRAHAVNGLRVPPPPMARSVSAHTLKEAKEYAAFAESGVQIPLRELDLAQLHEVLGEGADDLDENGVPKPVKLDHSMVGKSFLREQPLSRLQRLAGKVANLTARCRRPSVAEESTGTPPRSPSRSSLRSNATTVTAVASKSTLVDGAAVPFVNRAAAVLRRNRTIDCVPTPRIMYEGDPAAALGRNDDPNDAETQRELHISRVLKRHEQSLPPSDALMYCDTTGFLCAYAHTPAEALHYIPIPPNQADASRPTITLENVCRPNLRPRVVLPYIPRGIPNLFGSYKLQPSALCRTVKLRGRGRRWTRDNQFLDKTVPEVFAGDFGIGAGMRGTRRAQHT